MGPRRNIRKPITPANATRIVGYIRVSTSKQSEEGMSLETQQSKLKAYASLYDLELVECISDRGLSAKTLDRPGIQRALGMLQNGEAGGLLVVKLDRLTRSIRDLGDLVEKFFSLPNGPALLSVGEQFDTRTAAGRMVMNILMVIAQWERETIGERTSAVMQQMKAENLYTGGKGLYGYWIDENGTLQKDEIEQGIIALAKRLRSNNKLSFRDISAKLAERGLLSRSKKPFNPAAVMRMLTKSDKALRDEVDNVIEGS